jgi:crotonobetainyl-CoA:carnitine CoA-transferase CaiB-like acyl-CoA transferase
MPERALERLLRVAGLASPSDGEVKIAGRDPIASRFRLGEAAAAALAACGVAASEIWELRCGRRQQVRVSTRAAGASLLGFFFQRLAGRETPRPALSNPTVTLYPAKGGRWIHLHGGFPHLEDGTLRLLGCGQDAGEIARAVSLWEALALEEALAEAGLCGAAVRRAEEWLAHPPGPGAPAARPLSGLRVLDLTRVLAGPTCGRTLAEHGAEVLKISSPRLPSIEPFAIETGHGKRSAHLDLDQPGDAEQLRQLVRGADLFSQGYRSGALERLGFGVEELARLRPGLIHVSVNCYGHRGPWSGRRGWEQLAQCVTGIAAEQGSPERPQLVPAAACDYTTGYLAAFGALVALARRAREGGSYRVRASLCQTGMWIRGLGPAAPGEASGLELAELAGLMTESESGWGRLQHLAPVVELSETRPRWEQVTVPLGTHPPRWLSREVGTS